jgi:hypothetical protein
MTAGENDNVLQPNVSEIGIWNVADVNPAHFKHTLPLVGCPNSTASSVVNLGMQYTFRFD